MADTGVRKVRLAQVPADLVMREREHLDSLMRELYGSELLDHSSSRVAGRLAGLMDGVLNKAAPVRDACWSAARYGDQVTVDAEVTSDQARALDGILIVLEQAEAFCQEERLYARPSPSEVAELRAWMAEEVRRQLAGAAPSPCPIRYTPRTSMSPQPSLSGGVATIERPATAIPTAPHHQDSDRPAIPSLRVVPPAVETIEPEPFAAAGHPAEPVDTRPVESSPPASWWDRS